MILKGNQRGGGRQMALHLLNGEQNEHVSVHQVRGFIANDVLGALNEAYAISKGTQCRQFMYSLSLNPPPDKNVEAATFEKALERIESKLGLEGQPRVVVFHEKEGRRHAHCVWSRINIDTMTAINMSHDHKKLKTLAKSIFLENGWTMPDGYRDKSKSNPLNFTRTEWEQAARIGRKASDIKNELQECWAVSDNKTSFEVALQETGYFLAKGDKRSYVVIDHFGEIYSLPRQLGKKAKELESRLGHPDKLPNIEQTKEKIALHLSPLFKKFRDELAEHHASQKQTLLHEKHNMTKLHRKDRAELQTFLKKRWQEEENERAARFRKGFKGVWDMLSGIYRRTRKENEAQAIMCFYRDEREKEQMIQKQLNQRQALQVRIDKMREQQEYEQKSLIKDFAHLNMEDKNINANHVMDQEAALHHHMEHSGPEMEI